MTTENRAAVLKEISLDPIRRDKIEKRAYVHYWVIAMLITWAAVIVPKISFDRNTITVEINGIQDRITPGSYIPVVYTGEFHEECLVDSIQTVFEPNNSEIIIGTRSYGVLKTNEVKSQYEIKTNLFVPNELIRGQSYAVQSKLIFYCGSEARAVLTPKLNVATIRF